MAAQEIQIHPLLGGFMDGQDRLTAFLTLPDTNEIAYPFNNYQQNEQGAWPEQALELEFTDTVVYRSDNTLFVIYTGYDLAKLLENKGDGISFSYYSSIGIGELYA